MASDPVRASGSLSFAQLLKPELLASAPKLTGSSEIGTREQVKALLRPDHSTHTQQSFDPGYESFRQAHELLVQDFMARRAELGKLNRARKQQIENHLRAVGKPIGFDQLLHALPNTREHEFLLELASQNARFYLAELWLLRRWVSLDVAPLDQVLDNTRTVNWKITNILKKLCPKQMIQRHEWSFLKANIFSWYTPAQDTNDRLRDLVLRTRHEIPLATILHSGGTEKTSDEFLAKVFFTALDKRQEVAVFGRWNLGFLQYFLQAQTKKLFGKLDAHASNEFQQYMAEILALSEHAPALPRFTARLEPELTVAPSQAQLSASQCLAEAPNAIVYFCDPKQGAKDLNDALKLFELLPDNSVMLLASDSYWPTDEDEAAKKFREAITRKAACELILDNRQLVNSTTPRAVALLRVCSHKEARDNLRPHIVRLKGDGTHLEAQDDSFFELLRNPPEAGERNQASSSRGIRYESMRAAAIQGELKSSPWNALTDPDFFDISIQIRRAPLRVFNQGSLVPNQSLLVEAPQHSVHFVELPGTGIFSTASLAQTQLPEGAKHYLFLPDQGTRESLRFFSAWFNSKPMQFWYRLETDQTRGRTRSAEKLLKLSPLVRLDLSDLRLEGTSYKFACLEDARSALERLWPEGSELPRSWNLHAWVLACDTLLEYKLRALRDIVRHLYPDLTVERWSLPQGLPALKAAHAFKALLHLPQAAITQHPALQVTAQRGKEEIRIQELGFSVHGPVSELTIRGSREQKILVSGPTLFIRALYEQLPATMGRNAWEQLKTIQLPIDAKLVLSQVEQFQELIKLELRGVQGLVQLMDRVFCRLAGLDCTLMEARQAATIERFVSPASQAQPLRN